MGFRKGGGLGHDRIISFRHRTSNAELGGGDMVTSRDCRLRCSSQSDMLAAVRAGVGSVRCHAAWRRLFDLVMSTTSVPEFPICGSCHPDLVEMPAVREVNGLRCRVRQADKGFCLAQGRLRLRRRVQLWSRHPVCRGIQRDALPGSGRCIPGRCRLRAA